MMLFSENKVVRKSFMMTMKGKKIRHRTEVTILGNTMKDDLTWDSNVEKVVLPALRNRIGSLRIMSKFLDSKFRSQYAYAIFKSKLLL